MGKSTPKAPAPPDPVATANAQAAANEDTARLQFKLNAVNQNTPFGNVSYNEYAPDQWEQNVTLSPEQQGIFDSTMQGYQQFGDIANTQLGNVAQALGTPVDFSGLGGVPGLDDFSADRQRVEQALMSRLDPALERDRTALETRLANQGLSVGSDAWNRAIETANQAATDARMQALLAGGQEQSRMQQGALTSRNQAIQEMLQARNQPINEIGALLSQGQVQTPQFAAPPGVGVAPTDVIGAQQMAYQGRLNNYNSAMQSRAAGKGALGSFGAGALGAIF